MTHIPTNQEFIAYYRLSKAQYHKDGTPKVDPFGIDSQKKIIKNFTETHSGMLIKEFTEYQSGNRKSRHKRVLMLEAMDLARHSGAWLLFAYVDRVARDAAFLLDLMHSGIKFVCCDVPGANYLTLGVTGMVAEEYSRTASIKITRALDEKRMRGEPLGWICHKIPVSKLTYEHRCLGGQSTRQRAEANPLNQIGKAKSFALWLQGLDHVEIFRQLRFEGVKSPTGGILHVNNIKRWLAPQIMAYNAPQPPLHNFRPKSPVAPATPTIRLQL